MAGGMGRRGHGSILDRVNASRARKAAQALVEDWLPAGMLEQA